VLWCVWEGASRRSAAQRGCDVTHRVVAKHRVAQLLDHFLGALGGGWYVVNGALEQPATLARAGGARRTTTPNRPPFELHCEPAMSVGCPPTARRRPPWRQRRRPPGAAPLGSAGPRARCPLSWCRPCRCRRRRPRRRRSRRRRRRRSPPRRRAAAPAGSCWCPGRRPRPARRFSAAPGRGRTLGQWGHPGLQATPFEHAAACRLSRRTRRCG
jgi:hypothetical protein